LTYSRGRFLIRTIEPGFRGRDAFFRTGEMPPACWAAERGKISNLLFPSPAVLELRGLAAKLGQLSCVGDSNFNGEQQ
jgi:hypothetical protein